ncbi:unnamed protein product [Hermetia illucens]|uniref:Protein NDUFAF4 homolog n=1 Tax=Hermetia illucens TaxID=343691 RepID=A0A7R8UQS0_HERIL|nr:protein NDUFAF4 homolog [Hermetia illucens]CAD7085040.1 unnamed protein product [Hermetia illucens]
MGKVMSVMMRKANRFNVENRAHRLLDKEKRDIAPKFESNLRDMERVLKEEPDYIEKQSRKDTGLDNRLKQVYVTSKDTFIDLEKRQAENPNRPLPLDRAVVQDFEYGFMEPSRVTPGRCTLRQAMQFITDHNSDPEKWTRQKIAEEYKLKEENVGKILDYFRSFQIYIPDKHKRENILRVQPRSNKSLPLSDSSDSDKKQ